MTYAGPTKHQQTQEWHEGYDLGFHNGMRYADRQRHTWLKSFFLLLAASFIAFGAVALIAIKL